MRAVPPPHGAVADVPPGWKASRPLIRFKGGHERPAVFGAPPAVRTERVTAKKASVPSAPPPIHIVSGGTGTSGRLVVETALAQFPALQVPVVVRSRVRSLAQVEAAVRKAQAEGATVVHTLVDGALRNALARVAKRRGVAAIDLMGPLLDRVAGQTGARPLGQPGRYRTLRKDYFDRVEAIDFAIAHDDGNRPGGIPDADIVVVGVSRCGKTPLSMYLAVRGWKVANVPIVKGIPLPDEVFRVDPRRVVGLTVDCRQLVEYRKRREEHMGRKGVTGYSSPATVREELEAATRICRAGGFRMVDVTEKPVENIAVEIVGSVSADAGEAHAGSVPR